ncbi:MAG: hypothetical protein EOM85_02175 [Candidatus Moranbacteria bacterium]|nr:hypothetical protein [Candidatus Moranbacteria bacterium]
MVNTNKNLTKNQRFLSEKEGQIDFFSKLEISADIELTHNTDGVYKGTLFEFKLTIPDINKVLFQAIKYLSHRRIKGEPVPAQILLIALNEKNAYLFNSDNFLKEIETIYAGAASKDNSDFSTKIKPEKIEYGNLKGLQKIIEILENENFTKINIDVFDVVGWANRYYTFKPEASKSKLFEELRNPKEFKKFIYPWKGKDLDFKYINDLLNAKNLKKELGAFYTPAPYCLKATELVRKAIKQLPKDHDYIILDRTAGTGNLEEFLTDKKVDDITIGELDKYLEKDFIDKYLEDKARIIKIFYKNKNFDDITIKELEKQKTKINLHDYLFDNELSHTIVNTYELKEWIVLNERLGDKVKLIIPPNVDPKDQLVNGGDALSEHFVLGSKVGRMFISKEYLSIIDKLNSYVSNPKVNLILLENPPYRDGSGEEGYRKSYIREQMKDNKLGIISNDIANQFIWSGWKHYLKKPDDFFVLFSPIKYWKSLGLGDKKFIDGFLFNREYFHAGASAISCILWKNQNEKKEEITLKAFDIDNKGNLLQEDDEILFVKNIIIKKARKAFSEFTTDKWQENDEDGIIGSRDGIELVGEKKIGKWNKNILGYMRVNGFAVAPMNANLTTIGYKIDIKKNVGFYLRDNNFTKKLPLFAAKLYPQKNWYERDIYFTTADGGDKYTKDKNFLKSCFIFTCLSQRNHCRSFDGSDGRFYNNELCFDKNTLASKKLKEYKLTKTEEDLLDTFQDILEKAKKTENYNKKYSYGTYQIDDELNTRYKNENDEWIYDYPELNTSINSLKNKLSKYYESTIQPKLFEYELLK